MALGARARPLGLAAACAVVAAAFAPAPAAAAVAITSDPGLRPQFRTDRPDYVSRCDPSRPLRVIVKASGGDKVAVAGGPKRSGDFTVDVPNTPGADVVLRVTASGHTSTHHLRCLPPDFPNWQAKVSGTPESQFYALTPVGPHRFGYAAIFDARGTPIWWTYQSAWAPWDLKLLDNGNLMWSRQFLNLFGVNPNEAWEEHTLDGKLVRTLQTVDNPTDMHDLTPLANGNYLLDAYRPRCCEDLRPYHGPAHATVYDAEIQELTPAGALVWKWNSKGRIHLNETQWWDYVISSQNKYAPQDRKFDLVHINSVEPDGPNGVIFSSRFTNAVWRIDKRTKKITWKLGGSHRDESVAIKNDPLAKHPLGGNHDAREYRDGTVTVYDNGSSLDRPPRAVRYRVDADKHTATLVEAFGQSEIPRSGWGGSARKLPGGNWVVYWGGTLLMTERTADGRKQVLSLLMRGDRYSYRAFPIPRGKITAQAFRRGMNAMQRASGARASR